MTSAIAVLTYNRVHALKETLSGLEKYCSKYPIAIFDDCSNRDGTESFLRGVGHHHGTVNKEMLSEVLPGSPEVYLGTVNLGVAGNSNRALKWFEKTGADHLCLLNDDLHVLGDFVNFYEKAHRDLDIGFFSFCDFDKPSPAIGNNNPESYRWMTVNWRGYKVKLCPRMTGIMISITREVLNKVGYFDARFGKFGQEHCLSGETPIISRTHGLVNIRDVVEKTIEIWNGKQWRAVTVRQTGTDQQLVRVKFGDGSFLDCTPDHRFSVFRRVISNGLCIKTASKLTKQYRCEPTSIDADFGANTYGKDPYTLGFMVGDGCVSGDYVGVDLIGPKRTCPVQGTRGKPSKNCLPVNCQKTVDRNLVKILKTDPQGLRKLFLWDRLSILQFIAGLTDSDGTRVSVNNSGSIRIAVSNETRARTLQLLLTRCGIKSSVNLDQEKGTETNFGPRSDDLWYLQIPDPKIIPCVRLNTQQGKPARWKGKFQTIRTVEKLPGLHDTFCLTEETEHKCLFANVLTFQCDYTNRARFAGFMSINGQIQPQIDLECDPPVLRHQDVETSMLGPERYQADQESAHALNEIARRYGQEPLYKDFLLRVPRMAGGYSGVGIPVENATNYKLIDSPA